MGIFRKLPLVDRVRALPKGYPRVLLVVCLIAVVNLSLGFVAAIHLGYGPPSISAAWQIWLGRGYVAADRSAPAANNTAFGGDLDMSQLSISDDDLGNLLDEDLEDDILTDAMQDDESRRNEPGENERSEETGVETLVDPNAPENWDLNEKFVETSVLKLNIAMMKSGARATDIDSRLRACEDNPDLETIRACAALLKEDCEAYLAEQEEATTKMRDRLEEFGDLKSLAENIELSNMEQAAQIETTLNNLEFMDLESDLEAANFRLQEELSNLREARHKLRDGQDVAFAKIAQSENRMDKIHKPLFNDRLTGVRSRIGLEAMLFEWWQVGKHKTRQMCAALLDLENFGGVNKRHGPSIGDKVLTDIAQFIDDQIGSGDLLGRHTGQCFLIIMLDKGPRAAVKTAEFIRQSVERTTFVSNGIEFNLTMRGGYTEITPQDTPETFLQRLETSLRDAKAAGANKAFLHDGRQSEIVESPDLRANDRKVKLKRD